MRRILVDSARRKKRPSAAVVQCMRNCEEDQLVQAMPAEELLAVDEALDLLAKEDPAAANLVKLRYFVGMSME